MAGLVLEGGAQRCIFTAGVLDFFEDNDIRFPYVIGVSAGACQAFSYISRQRGRNLKVCMDYIRDRRYLSYRQLLRKGELFGMDFVFDKIPKELLPLDFEALNNTDQQFVIGVMNCLSGEAEYGSNTDGADLMAYVRASSSLPMLAKPIIINSIPYLDGGIVDAIPIKKAISDGNEKNVVVLTRNEDYRKRYSKAFMMLLKCVGPKFPAVFEVYEQRHLIYNSTLEEINRLEKSGRIFVIRPQKRIKVTRAERNVRLLRDFYDDGYATAAELNESLQRWLKSE